MEQPERTAEWSAAKARLDQWVASGQDLFVTISHTGAAVGRVTYHGRVTQPPGAGETYYVFRPDQPCGFYGIDFNITPVTAKFTASSHAGADSVELEAQPGINVTRVGLRRLVIHVGRPY